jgi:hypothetical protein
MKSSKRLLMIALPVLAMLFVIAFYDYVYLGVGSAISSIRDEQDIKMKTLTKYVALIAQKQDFEKQLADLREQAKARTVRFVPGEAVSIASANLQALVKGIVIERGGILTSERIGKPDDLEKAPSRQAPASAPNARTLKKTPSPSSSDRIQVLSVSIDAAVPDIAALSDILYSIETRTPDLVIKEMDVRVKNFREPRDLLVRIEVIGLYEGK